LREKVEDLVGTGADDLPRVFLQSLKALSRRDFPSFRTRDEALAWLVKE